MPQQVITRLYSMADADLKQKADILTKTIQRDIADFGTRNIKASTLQDFDKLIEAFDNTSTDEELLGFSITATEEKDAIAESLRRAIRPIRNMAELEYKGKGKYNVFGFENLSEVSDNDLYRLGRRVARVANRLKPDLLAQGLTDTQITAISDLCTQLDLAIDHIGEQAENRDIETQDRVLKGNALYTEMMRLASIGKSLYEDKDEARFNDYVLVGGSSKPDSPADSDKPVE